jgi:1-deoxy-D-xylulose-5-phosphate synthase
MMTVTAPMDECELRNLMYTASLGGRGPFSIRYPRGRGVSTDWRKPFREIPIGKGRMLREGDRIAVISVGPVGNTVAKVIEQAAAEGIEAGHADLRFIKPLDDTLLEHIADRYRQVITVEDGGVDGGAGSAILEWFGRRGYPIPIRMLGVPDRFVQHGSIGELQRICGFDAEGILAAIRKFADETF